MNTDEMQRVMDQFLVGPFNAPNRVILWSQTNPVAAWIVAIIYLLIWLHAIAHCLSSHTGIDRTTWLILLLFLPVFGIVFYWAIANRSAQHADLSIYSSVPPPPAPRTGRSIAEEITADLAKRKRT